jgi:tRNA nucleotidyltransferase (CCA-adding enzyme)
VNTSIKFYRVGGWVRDHILGIKSKDIDYAVEAPSYEAMVEYIKAHGKIYQERPEFLTVRARINGEDCDYVMCRKEGAYSDGRHPDQVEPGTIFDDLARRDFTVNAIAMDQGGQLIDPFGGQKDLANRLLRCVGNAYDRFNEDSLRLFRAIRFSITKGMIMHIDVQNCMFSLPLLARLETIPIERIREELVRCFQHDTYATLVTLNKFQNLQQYVFRVRGLQLTPTIVAK